MEYPPRAGGPPPQQNPPDIAPQFRPSPNHSPNHLTHHATHHSADGSTGRLPEHPSESSAPGAPTADPDHERPQAISPADPGLPYAALLQPQGDVARVVLGFALLAVPVVAAVLAYLLPTIRTIQLSRIEGLGVFGSTETLGPANYDAVLADGAFIDGLTRLAGPTIAMVLAGAVIAPLAAWCLDRAGGRVRAASRIVWSLAAIAFAPAALTTAWLIDRVLTENNREASLYDWTGLASGTVLGLGVLAGLAAMRGGAETGRKAACLLTTAGLAAFAVTAAGLQTFAFTAVSGLPEDAPTPVAQIFNGLYSGLAPGDAAAKSVLLMAILAILGLGAAILFAAARTRIDVAPGPVDPTPTRPPAAVAGLIALVLLLATVGYFLLPWIIRLAEGTSQGDDLWFTMRRTWGPPLITTVIALPAAAIGGYAIGALRPLGHASRWILLPFAPWLFTGSGPLGIANLEAVAGQDEYMVIGSFPPRAWIAIPLLFVFTALFWGLEDRRRAAVAGGLPPRPARLAFLKAAWPMTALMALALLLVNAQDLFWQQLTFQDMLSTGPMIRALEHLEFEQSGVALGFPIPILAVYALAVTVAAIWYLPRLAIKAGRD